MNKNFLLSLFTLLLISLCSFAQKEYNMVITLNNGTTVTLGHNDIKNITFNDGEVSITGNMVNTIDSLVQASKEMQVRIKEEMEWKAIEVSNNVGFSMISDFEKTLQDGQGVNFIGVVNALDNRYVNLDEFQQFFDAYIRTKLDTLWDAYEKQQGSLINKHQ